MLSFEGFFNSSHLNPARNTDNEIIGLVKLVEVVAIRFLLYLLILLYVHTFGTFLEKFELDKIKCRKFFLLGEKRGLHHL